MSANFLVSVIGRMIGPMFLAFCAATSLADDTQTEISSTEETAIIDLTITQVLHRQNRETLSIWQGYKHEWLRDLVPHRISTFINYIDSQSDGNQIVYRLGQDTGVDGNYMHPVSYSTTIDTKHLISQTGTVRLEWTDAVEGEDIPSARSKLFHNITIPHGALSADKVYVFLQGIELNLTCENWRQHQGQECNSDGMWPYLFNAEVAACQDRGSDLTCSLKVDIFRGWTPTGGGDKPLNSFLTYDLSVHFGLLGGTPEQITGSGIHRFSAQGSLQQSTSNPGYDTIQGVAGYDHGIAVIKRFSFRLLPPEEVSWFWTLDHSLTKANTAHRGRYLSSLIGAIEGAQYNAQQASLGFRPLLKLGAPATVVDSKFNSEMDLQLIQFKQLDSSPEYHLGTGKICLNNKPESFFYSYWKKCNLKTPYALKKYGGVERSELTVTVPLAP